VQAILDGARDDDTMDNALLGGGGRGQERDKNQHG
jgi:hypothetical protein